MARAAQATRPRAQLRDAAHSTHPFAANDSARAILDARTLGHLCGTGGDPTAIPQTYEAERLGPVSEIVNGYSRLAGFATEQVR